LADKESSLGPNKIPIPIVLVGTKYDLKDHRQVTREEMVAFVEEYDLTGCMEVSAKTAYNVDEAVK
jgi:GTPase SAR1 family protein